MLSMVALNQLSALTPGADLWICPDTQNSQWAQKLDWQLNHQIQKGLSHKTQVLDNQVKGLLYENQITWADVQAPHENLLISSSLQLPTRWVLVLLWNGQRAKWVGSVFSHWQQLQKPSLRVFLPQNLAQNEFAQEWQKLTDFVDLTMVLD
jgi:hypothetical protein